MRAVANTDAVIMAASAPGDEISNSMPRMVRSARRETIRELEDMLQAAVDGRDELAADR
jgi:hypothetical protein